MYRQFSTVSMLPMGISFLQIKQMDKNIVSLSRGVSEIGYCDWNRSSKSRRIVYRKLYSTSGDLIAKNHKVEKRRNLSDSRNCDSHSKYSHRRCSEAAQIHINYGMKWIIASFFYQIIKPHGSVCDLRAKWLQLQENNELLSLPLTLWLWCWWQCCLCVCACACVCVCVCACVCMCALLLCVWQLQPSDAWWITGQC